MQKFNWNEFNKLGSYNDICSYINEREYKHGKFCHYSNLNALNGILGSQSFYISCVSKFNDICDREQFGDKINQRYYYSLCFSTGINENLSLWYLYAGIKGTGGRIVLTSPYVKKLVEESTYSLYINKNNEKNLIPIKENLEENKDFKKTFKDIIYYKNSDDGINADLKYNTMTNHTFPIGEFEKYKNENIGFQKNLIWYYEKETRLLVEIIDNKLKKRIDDVCNDENTHVIVILKFNDNVYKNISVNFAPEIKSIDEICTLDNYANIKNFMQMSSRLKLSDYHGQIEMNLCQKCNKCELCEKNKK